MTIAAFRTKQTTQTAGTGTVTLDAAAGAMRSFQASLGSSARRITYCISWASGFEIGLGDFDGGLPGTLTRTNVLASSNAGSLVSLPAGTKDVFSVLVPGQGEVLNISTNYTVLAADLGNLLDFGGTTTSNISLPAYATVPMGSELQVRHSGSTGILSVVPNGAETINGAASFIMLPGDSTTVRRNAAGWSTVGVIPPWRSVSRTVVGSAVASVDLSLPTAFSAFQLEWSDLIPAAAAGLYVRYSTDGGSTYQSGASAYNYTGVSNVAAAAVATYSATASIIALGPAQSTTGYGFGRFTFSRNTGVARFENAFLDGTPAYNSVSGTAGIGAGSTVTNIRIAFISQNMNAGNFNLLGKI